MTHMTMCVSDRYIQLAGSSLVQNPSRELLHATIVVVVVKKSRLKANKLKDDPYSGICHSSIGNT